METPLNPSSPSPSTGRDVPEVALGDRRWERPRFWAESEPAMAWPPELLEAFSLRMARHGMSISRPLMLSDKRYALQQLVHAQAMSDDALRLMALRLFRHFEARQSGIPALH